MFRFIRFGTYALAALAPSIRFEGPGAPWLALSVALGLSIGGLAIAFGAFRIIAKMTGGMLP